jgi:hypothetical protein
MSTVLDLLLEPMRYEFFRNARLTALMVGVLSGVTGVYIVLRGPSYNAASGNLAADTTAARTCNERYSSARPA